MGIFDRLSHLMPHSVTFRPYDRAASTEGDPVYDEGAAFTMTPAQVVDGPVKVVSDAGDMVVGAGQVIVGPSPALAEPFPELVLPGDRVVRVIRVDKYPDASGLAVQRVVYG